MTVYQGIAFPFAASADSFPAAATDDDLIKQALQQLILTAKGERIMRPEYGTGAHDFVFETNNDLLAVAIRTAVAAAIAKFEPRVIVQRIDVERDSSDGSFSDSVIVTVYYVVRVTQQEDEVSVTLGSNQGAA